MAYYSDIVTDQQTKNPVSGVVVTVLNSAGTLASLTNNSGAAIGNPLLTDSFGHYEFNAVDAVYQIQHRYGGRLVREDEVIVGEPPEFAGPPGPLPTVVSPTGAPTTFQRHIVKNYIEDISGFTTGSSGDAAANATVLNAALATGTVYEMRPGELYRIGSRLNIPSNAGLVFNGSRKPTIYMPAANFTRADNLYATRYGTNAVGIGVYGQLSGSYTPASNVSLAGFILQSEVNGNRSISGIAAQNAKNLTIDGVEIFGLPLGIGVNLQSVVGASVRNLWCHDFYSDTTLAALVTNAPNATGLMVGGDEVNGIASSGILIDGFRMENIRVGTNFRIANGGEQSDGVNIAATSSRVTVANGIITNIGEGVDCFGSDCIFDNLQMTDMYIFGMKFIHGAQRNKASNISVVNVGLAGAVFSGSSFATQDTSANIINNLSVKNLNANGAWTPNDTAGVLFNDNSAVNCRPRDNQVNGAYIDPGAGGKYGWLDTSTGSGNVGHNVQVKTGALLGRSVLVINNGGKVQLKGSNAYLINQDPANPVPIERNVNPDAVEVFTVGPVSGNIHSGDPSRWLEAYRPNALDISQIRGISVGYAGVLGASRSSDNAQAGNMGCIGGQFFAINNNATQVQSAYGLYVDVTRAVGAGTTHAFEFDIVNRGSIVDIDPHSGFQPGMTPGIWAASGGEYAVNDATAAYVVVNNAAKWRKGLVFMAGGLWTRPDAKQEAISFGYRDALTFYGTNRNVLGNLYSDGSGDGITKTDLAFTGGTAEFRKADGSPILRVTQIGTRLFPTTFGVLTAAFPASGNDGMIARITDAASPITTFNQVVTAGGGTNKATVISNGTNYVAISS